MFESKSPRPTLPEFTDAAIRFTDPAQYYPSWVERSHVVHAFARFGSMLMFMRLPSYPERLDWSKRTDRAIIRREQEAEGLVPGEENPSQFAINQLARYKQLQ